VAQLYPQAPSTHFSRLLRHAWATVGLFFSRSPHGVKTKYSIQLIKTKLYICHRYRSRLLIHNPLWEINLRWRVTRV